MRQITMQRAAPKQAFLVFRHDLLQNVLLNTQSTEQSVMYPNFNANNNPKK